jgi:hypothetical protein
MQTARRSQNIALGCLTVVACGLLTQPSWSLPPTVADLPTATPTAPQPENFLVSVRRQGGMCLPPGCFSDVTIATDGTYRYTTHFSQPTTGKIREFELKLLKQRIAFMNFDKLRSQPEGVNPTPELCMVAFDGPEVIYTFQVKGQRKEIRGCRTRINPNEALFRQLGRLYQQISAQPGEPQSQRRTSGGTSTLPEL